MDSRIKAVVFNEEEHTYLYNGKRLKGVTGAICRLMNKSFPQTDTVKLATLYGSDVHKEVENYYNLKSGLLSTDSAKWVVKTLEDFSKDNCKDSRTECEVMVSDFEGTASKVDVVMHDTKGNAFLFDIKTTSHFDRPYCSLQLSIYKRLFEENYGEEVKGMFVLATKAKRLFHILEQDKNKVDKILLENKG
jgi:hypothetical protein